MMYFELHCVMYCQNNLKYSLLVFYSLSQALIVSHMSYNSAGSYAGKTVEVVARLCDWERGEGRLVASSLVWRGFLGRG